MCVYIVCTSERRFLWLKQEFKEFYIQKIGDIYVAYPVDDPWATVRQVIGTFPPDFMEDRCQPSWEEVEKREEL